MASSLAKFLSPVGDAYATAGFGQGYTPFGSVAGAAQTQFDTAPKAGVQQGQDWNPTAQSLANQIGMWQGDQAAEAQAKLMGLGSQGMSSIPGGMASLGGDWAGVDQWNAQIQAAAAKYGVPANLIKSIMKLESGGANLAANGAGAVGPMQVVSSIWGGLGYDLNDPAQNIMAGAAILKENYDSYAGWAQENGIDPWKAATYSYYAGNPYNLSAADDPAQGGSGMSTADYGNTIWAGYQQLNGVSGGGGGPIMGGAPSGSASNVINAVEQYLGSPYVWGGIPGKGQPGGNWDCSGLTYWADQNYGNGQLPMGSHYQYQYAVDTGQLFTDQSQLQPGDLVFFNTGWQGGAGSELNGAGHVAMYIGNGQMVHAANPDQGTIISDFTNYAPSNGYQYMGALHMGWSGGTGGIPGVTGGQQPAANQGGWWNDFLSHYS